MSYLDKLLLGLKTVMVGGIAVPVPRPNVNFASGASAADNSTLNSTDITILAGGPYGGVPIVTPPPSASFAWVNQVAATASDSAFGTGFDVATAGDNLDDLHCRVIAAPATPYTLTVGLTLDIQPGSAYRAGVIWRESATGKILLLGFDTSNSSDLCVENWTSATSGGSTYPAGAQLQDYTGDRWIHSPMWMRMKNDGTNLTWTWSQSGYNYQSPAMTAGSGPLVEPKNDFFTVGPNQIGVAVGATLLAPTFQLVQMHIFSWQVTSP